MAGDLDISTCYFRMSFNNVTLLPLLGRSSHAVTAEKVPQIKPKNVSLVHSGSFQIRRRDSHGSLFKTVFSFGKSFCFPHLFSAVLAIEAVLTKLCVYALLFPAFNLQIAT